MMTHWLACIWWLLGVAEINNASYNTDDPYLVCRGRCACPTLRR